MPMWCNAPGCYTCKVTIGDTRFETFQLCLDGDPSRPIYPAVHNAGSSVIILTGTDGRRQSKQWLIHGRDQAAPSGTTYRIRFEWKGFHQSISWEVEAGPPGHSP